MSTLFSGINLALRAVLSHQQAIEVIEHNVANANTEGYSRQEAVLAAGLPHVDIGMQRSSLPGQMGTGVMVDRIRRFNMEFFDGRYRGEVGEAKRWEVYQEVLEQVEITLAETSEDGVIPKLDAFWGGWQALSSDPTNLALRADLRERAEDLARSLNRRASELRLMREDQDAAVIQRVEEVNGLASQVARLNAEIAKVFAVGDQPNDLLDERDRLLDRLAEITGATASQQNNGEVLVSIGGHALVVGNTACELETTVNPLNTNLVDVGWSDGQDLVLNTGELRGLIQARDEAIVEQIDGLDDLAAELINRVNTLHQNGFGLENDTALDFFDGSDALSIRLSSDIDSLSKIAASANPDAPADGTIAQQLAEVRNELLMDGGTTTINDYYISQVTCLGIDIQSAATAATDRKLVADSLDNQRESVSGVSLDEEAANLVKFQRAYQAALRLMTILDDTLDRVINGMGRVGL